MKVLVTGGAGFIGSKVAAQLAAGGHSVTAIDNLNAYYDPNLKLARLRHFYGIDAEGEFVGKLIVSPLLPSLDFLQLDIRDPEGLERLFTAKKFDKVVHLAAQPGVRYSLENPASYVDNNVMGFIHILESCRRHDVGHLVYASSSSIYGNNHDTPFRESDPVDNQVSIYAATKRSDELMANVYTHLYGLRTTGLRFFTVYGPWGRPDMAPMLFAKNIIGRRPIKIYNHGNMSRDFTYIDDIVNGIERVVNGEMRSEEEKMHTSIYNIGCGCPMQLMTFIQTLEDALGVKAEKEFLPMQPGDTYVTYADTAKLQRDYGYRPTTALSQGIADFAKWYKSYYGK